MMLGVQQVARGGGRAGRHAQESKVNGVASLLAAHNHAPPHMGGVRAADVCSGAAQSRANACSKSAQMSSALSMPQEKRMRLSRMPTCARFSAPWSQ